MDASSSPMQTATVSSGTPKVTVAPVDEPSAKRLNLAGLNPLPMSPPGQSRFAPIPKAPVFSSMPGVDVAALPNNAVSNPFVPVSVVSKKPIVTGISTSYTGEGDKCGVCHSSAAVLWCADCALRFCSSCEPDFHTLPADASHKRLKLR
jgi:hypothetical protein